MRRCGAASGWRWSYPTKNAFYAHSGVDWQAITSTAWTNLWSSKTRGATTITVQLAGLLDADLKRSSGGRSLVQKPGRHAVQIADTKSAVLNAVHLEVRGAGIVGK